MAIEQKALSRIQGHSSILVQFSESDCLHFRVMIIFGWCESQNMFTWSVRLIFSVNAPLRILEKKYAVKHRLHWPSADIVIIQSHLTFIWSSQEKRVRTVWPTLSSPQYLNYFFNLEQCCEASRRLPCLHRLPPTWRRSQRNFVTCYIKRCDMLINLVLAH